MSSKNKSVKDNRENNINGFDVQETLEKKIVYWREKLLDLSRRNRLIFFRDYKSSTLLLQSDNSFEKFKLFTEGQKVHIHKFPEELEEGAQERLFEKSSMSNSEESSGETNDVWLPDYNNKETHGRLYNLYLKSRESLREQGTNTLFVAFGFLHYYDAKHSEEAMSAPLLLAPASIERVSGASKDRHGYALVFTDEDIQFNPTLSQKLKKDFSLKIPDLKEDTSLEDWMKIFKKIVSRNTRWSVEEGLCVGIFSFQKLLLYLDLEKYKDKILESPILQVFSGAPLKTLGDFGGVPKEEEIDQKVSPLDIHQVLDADSSQQVVIEAAKKGLSFVTQGPPGTGKSQTIVNIIAELLSKGKRILFVSQKAAALEVVKKRLDAVGLGEYCLELHSYKANKKAVLKQLEEQLTRRRKIEFFSEEEEFFPQLTSCRQELNNFGVDLLKTRGNLKKSVYEMVWDLALLDNAPTIECEIKNPLEVSRREFIDRKMDLAKLENYKEEVTNYKNYFWKGTILKNFSRTAKTNLESELRILLEYGKDLQKLIKRVAKEADIKIDNLNSLDKFYLLLEKIVDKPAIGELKESLFFKNIEQEERKTKAIINKLYEAENIFNHLSSVYHESYFNLPVKEILSRYSREFSGLHKLLKQDYWLDLYQVLRLLKKKTLLFNVNIEKDLKALSQFKKIRLEIENLKNDLAKIYGEKTVDKKGWKQRYEAIAWLKEVRSIANLSKKIVLELFRDDNALPQLLEDYVKIYKKRFKLKLASFLSQYFGKELTQLEKPISQIKMQSLLGWISNLKNSVSSLRDWLEFNNHLNSLDHELKKYVEMFLQNSYSPSYLAEGYCKRFSECFLKEIESDFNPKRGEYYDSLVEKFRQLDDNHKFISKKQIIHKLEEHKPYLGEFSGTNTSEINIINREIRKKRRLKPLRELFIEASNLLFVLKPCFMMSPLSVVQYINLKKLGLFDTVIFDEASQIVTEDAVSSLIRAKQAIIVGDSQQLPPTTFFSNIDEGMDDIEEEVEDLESILDNAAISMENKFLRWHYRSKDESLIAFSNHEFYNNRLITFPNSKLKSTDMGVEHVYVGDAAYDRGASRQNIGEAERVIKLIENHIKKKPKKSLGVVALSIQQQRAIQDRVEMFRRQKPQYSWFFEEKDVLEEFFVKNLERVQGDERDVMIFSIGYGPDAAGKMTLNFGPINKTGGYKRLNVAITRAKEKVYLISSFQPESIDLDRVPNRGLRSLLFYMKYAKDGVSALSRKIRMGSNLLDFESDFEEAVHKKLVENGWDLSTQIGVSDYRIDLAIKNPQRKGEFILGIECDGAVYHSSATARDRDRIRRLVLENLGWNIHRIWSTDWLVDSKREVRKIEKKIRSILLNKASITDKDNKKEREMIRKEIIVFESNRNEDSDSVQQKYEVFNLKKERKGISAFNSAYFTVIKKDVLKIIKAESPIHIDLLLRRVAEGWGISKVGANVRRTVIEELESLQEAEVIKDGDILWYRQKKEIIPFRMSREDQRPLESIPPQELGGLIVKILNNAFSIERDDLMLAIAKQLGYTKRGRKIISHIEKTLDYLNSIGVIEEVGNRIRLKKSINSN